MKLILKGVFNKLWSRDTVFDQVNAIEGRLAKAKDNRRVIRFELEDEAYYLKYHKGVGWLEIFKNLIQGKIPVLGALNEWQAINKLATLNVDVMDAMAYGCKGHNPAQLESFLITRELKNTISLEKLCEQWLISPPSYSFKKTIVERVASIAKTLKENGFNHRDFYICHFLLECGEESDVKDRRLFLVDLHRMQMRKKVPQRWLVKDIGSLYFSAANIGLTLRDIVRFMRCYGVVDVRKDLQSHFWADVKTRALALHNKNTKGEFHGPL